VVLLFDPGNDGEGFPSLLELTDRHGEIVVGCAASPTKDAPFYGALKYPG
jgi:hypothetical protein